MELNTVEYTATGAYDHKILTRRVGQLSDVGAAALRVATGPDLVSAEDERFARVKGAPVGVRWVVLRVELLAAASVAARNFFHLLVKD